MFFSTSSLLFLTNVIIINVVLLAREVRAQSGISVVMGNKQYYIDDSETGNFYEGVHFCAQYDMKLASIENKAELNRLFTVLKTNDAVSKAYWLSGISFGGNTVFTWLGTGRAVNYWGGGTEKKVADKCLSLTVDTLLIADNACTGEDSDLPFICEKPLEPNCGKYGQCRYTYSYNTN